MREEQQHRRPGPRCVANSLQKGASQALRITYREWLRERLGKEERVRATAGIMWLPQEDPRKMRLLCLGGTPEAQ